MGRMAQGSVAPIRCVTAAPRRPLSGGTFRRTLDVMEFARGGHMSWSAAIRRLLRPRSREAVDHRRQRRLSSAVRQDRLEGGAQARGHEADIVDQTKGGSYSGGL